LVVVATRRAGLFHGRIAVPASGQAPQELTLRRRVDVVSTRLRWRLVFTVASVERGRLARIRPYP